MNKPLVTNTDDPAQIKKAAKKETNLQNQELQDIKDVLKTKAGQRVLWKYMEKCGVFTSSFASDPYSTSFNEGRRSIGLGILNNITEANPDMLVSIMKEKGE